MATLTGAQGIATGKYHAAVLSNSELWEAGAVRAGRVSGDLVHPVPYTPELHFSEFSSCVADFKNSISVSNFFVMEILFEKIPPYRIKLEVCL